MSNLELLLITNQPDEAFLWDKAGVNYIFIDLEILGKDNRQGHLNTVISHHTIEDISLIRPQVSNGELLVRINPLNSGSLDEVAEVISRGADVIMLPMFKSHEDIQQLQSLVKGRCKVYPLIETPEALNDIENLANIKGVDGYHIGLNDLHIAHGNKFLFEVMLSNSFKVGVETLRKKSVPFGIGGVSRLGGGALPAELILKEHYRLGSSRVILSRAFKSEVNNNSAEIEVIKVKEFYAMQAGCDLSKNESIFKQSVKKIVDGIV